MGEARCFDPERTHWLGALQTDEYHDVLAISDVHPHSHGALLYWSWSLLEAMAAGCALVCSATRASCGGSAWTDNSSGASG